LGFEGKFNLFDNGEIAAGALVGTSFPVQGGPAQFSAAGLVDMAVGPINWWSNGGLTGMVVFDKLFLMGTYTLGLSFGISGPYSAYVEHTSVIGGGVVVGLLQSGVTWAKDDLAFDGYVQPYLGGGLTVGVGVSHRWGAL
jgi:apolipoprotein N-acyltransferase